MSEVGLLESKVPAILIQYMQNRRLQRKQINFVKLNKYEHISVFFEITETSNKYSSTGSMISKCSSRSKEPEFCSTN